MNSISHYIQYARPLSGWGFGSLTLSIVALLCGGCGGPGANPANSGVSLKGSRGAKVVEKSDTPILKTGPVADPGEGLETEPADDEPKPKPGPKRFKDRRTTGPKEAIAVPANSTRELHEPVVVLSEAHAKLCLVKVGDTFPDVKLPEIGGSEEDIAALKGEKLTVVVFWNAHKVYAAEQFARLKTETAESFSKFGVNVVAINVGDAPEKVAQFARQYEIDFPCLLDTDGAAFKLVGQDKLPRTYLLDPSGKILWFDIEYSQGSQFELTNAVYYYLKKSE